MHMILWMYILVQYSQATAKQDCATAARASMQPAIAALSEQSAITVVSCASHGPNPNPDPDPDPIMFCKSS